MRRSDLEVTESARLDAIIQSSDCVRLAFADGTHPYIVPVSFGYRREEGQPVFYFHSAAAGRKVDLARALRYAGFELDTNRAVNPNEKPCDFSLRYECVVGEGDLSELTEPTAKAEALNLIMQHYSSKNDWEFPEIALSKTLLFRLAAKEMTGRVHK